MNNEALMFVSGAVFASGLILCFLANRLISQANDVLARVKEFREEHQFDLISKLIEAETVEMVSSAGMIEGMSSAGRRP